MPAPLNVMLDGNLGQSGQPLVSINSNGVNDFAVDASLGKLVGSNLFFSFWQFILDTGESATFTGPANVQNILARVTGGGVSNIDGSINVNISGANFFLMNPAGVVFKANANIALTGSFAVTTADYLKFSDGSRFTALPGPADTSLSAASVSAYGFLAGKQAPPSPVTFTGSGDGPSTLATTEGMSFTVVAGNQTIDAETLSAPAAQLTLVSVAGPGEVPAVASLLTATPLTALPALGTITLQNSAFVSAGSSQTNQSGHVEIDAATVTVDSSNVDATMVQIPSGGPAGDASSILVRCQTLIVSDSGQISAAADGFGMGGTIGIQARDVTLTNGSLIQTTTSGESIGGDITLTANTLNISDSSILSSAHGAGAAGNVDITVNNISIIGAPNSTASGIIAESGFEGSSGKSATGRGGDISVSAQQVSLTGGGEISATTFGPGQGGNVSVTASDISISGSSSFTLGVTTFVFQSGILASSELPGAQGIGGQSGSIVVAASSLNISNNGLVTASTVGSGGSGNVTINADSIMLDGTGASLPTGIDATTSYQNGGRGGDISIAASSLQVLGGAGISAATGGRGTGGNVSVSGGSVVVSGENSVITAQTTGTEGGAGGNLRFNVNSVALSGGGQISASTQGSGQGGSIAITADELTVTGNASSIVAETSGTNTTVTNAPNIEGVSVTLTFQSTSDSRLEAFLTDPGGDKITLFNKGDATGTNLTNTTFNESGATPISAGVNPYTGVFQSAVFLGVFNGGVASGTWDLAVGNVGLGRNSATLQAASLTVNGQQLAAVNLPQTIASGLFDVDFTVSLPNVQTPAPAGGGGSIHITAGTVVVSNGGTINASTLGDGAAGTLNIQATSVVVNATGAVSNTGFFASTAPGSTGRGGSISISAEQIQVTGSSNAAITGGIIARSATSAPAGDITVQSGEVMLDADAVMSSANLGGGPAGSVDVMASNSITLQGGSLITVVAQGSNAGTISLTAGQNVELRGGSTITASADAGGGSVLISAGALFDLDHSSIVATAGSGAGGNITIDPAFITLDHGLISANAAGAAQSSNAGNISLTAGQSVELNDDSTVTASAAASGGSIVISAGSLFSLDHSSIIATAGTGSGGDITIDPTFIILNHGLISANAAAGAGGNIVIEGQYFFDNGNPITATGSTAGTVQITTLPLDLVNALAELQGGFIDISTALQDRCAMRLGTDFSSFLVIGRGGVEDSPDEPQEEAAARLRQKARDKTHGR